MFHKSILLHVFFLLTLSLAGQNNDYQLLRQYTPSVDIYPSFNLVVDYFNFSDSAERQSIVLFENNLPAKITLNEEMSPLYTLKLHFIILADSLGNASYISRLPENPYPNVTSDLLLFVDDTIFWPKKTPQDITNTLGWQVIHDTTRFSRLFSDHIATLNRPEDICILITDNLSLPLLSALNRAIEKQLKDQAPFFIILYRKSSLKNEYTATPHLDKFSLGIIQFDPARDDVAAVMEAIDPLLHATRLLRWESPAPLSMQAERSVKVEIDGLSSTGIVSIPDTVLKKYFLGQTIETADSLLLKESMAEIADMLSKWYKMLPSEAYIEKARQLLDLYSKEIVASKHPTPLTEYLALERKLNMPLGSTYAKDKYNRLVEFYSNTDEDDRQHEERLNIAEYLVKARPDIKLNQYRLHWAKARKYDSQGKKWEALEAYSAAHNTQKNEATEQEIKRLIELCLAEAFQNKEWQRVKQYGTSHGEFLGDSFKLRFYTGYACYKLGDYPNSISHYEWLVNNWQDNPDLSWDDAFNVLAHSYTCSFRFDEAVKLSQRIFQEKQETKSLHMVILNLRMSWLKPFIDACNAWLLTVPPEFRDDNLPILTRINMPQYIGSIMLTGPKGEMIKMIYKNKMATNLPSQPNEGSSSNAMIIIDKDFQWFISQVSQGNAIGLGMSNYIMDQQEIGMLSAIGREPYNNLLWKQLTSYEDRKGARLFSELTTVLMEASLRTGGSAEPERYWSALKNNRRLRYMAMHKPDGSIKFEKNFDPSKGSFNETDWYKSSRTTAFYMIDMKYDGNEVFDLTNPLFSTTGWDGAVRFGINKQ